MMKYLGITGGDQFRLKSFLPGNVISKYQADTTYTELFHTVVHNFITVFFKRGVVFHVSAFGWMTLCIAAAIFIIIFQKDRREKKKVLCVSICILLMFCFYNLFLLWTYLTTMSEGEAISVKCYDRYIGTYIMGWFGLCVYLLFFNNIGGLKIQYLILGVFFLYSLSGFLDRNTYLKEIDSEIMEIYELNNSIKECIPDADYDDFKDMPDLWISCADH
ncbi:MAG: hypothetical protein NC416_12325, partial [Eubacterium sp.]|nr:hypothetical protein [Eubacterium sp.]